MDFTVLFTHLKKIVKVANKARVNHPKPSLTKPNTPPAYFM